MEVIAHRGLEHTPEPRLKADGTPVVNAAGKPVIIAPTYDENSIGALVAAATGGFDVEFDVRATKDGIGIISHDDVLENEQSSLSIEHTLLHEIQLARLVNMSRQRDGVPMLTDVLESLLERPKVMDPATLHMELKSRGAANAAHRAISALGLYERHITKNVIVSSFSSGELMAFWSLYPSVRLAWLRDETQIDPAVRVASIIKEGGFSAVHLSLPLAVPEVLEWYFDLGVDVRVFTVNDPVVAINLRQTGFVAGIFTDFPRQIAEALR